MKGTSMFGAKPRFIAFLMMALLLCLAGVISAQEETTGMLTSGQPSIGDVAAGETLRYGYILPAPRIVTLQALGDAVQPTITILQGSEIVAEQLNTAGEPIVSLSAFLNAGSYIVEVSAANDGQGTITLALQSETPVNVQPLLPTNVVDSEVNAEAPIAVFSFNALPEPAYLYVESDLPDSGSDVRLLNTTTQRVIAMVSADVVGARFRVPGGSSTYQVIVSHSGSALAEPFRLCLSAVSQGGCEVGSTPAATPEAEPTPVSAAACIVTSAVGGPVNIRQSASTSAAIIGALPFGSNTDVLGIAPNGLFYNILFNDLDGWVSLSVVTATGDCANVTTVEPPPVIAQPVQPTQPPPTAAPTQPAATQAPTPVPPSPTPSGPCLISITGDMLVYTQPDAIPDYIYDEVTSGYELVPVGRLADNSWWRTNYASAWIQTSAFGSTAAVSGDCSSLPVVSP
jgi:hypothetical protein